MRFSSKTPQSISPPSTTTAVPTMYRAAGDSRNASTPATSPGSPMRPAGMLCRNLVAASGPILLSTPSASGVCVGPETQDRIYNTKKEKKEKKKKYLEAKKTTKKK